MRQSSDAHREMRINTLMKVVNAIRGGFHSKREIKEETKLSWGSCSEIINLLSTKGLIRPCKTENTNDGKPGRKTTGVEFNRNKFLLAGMELKARSVDCSLINIGKVELNRKEYRLTEKVTNENICRQIASVYINFLVDSGVKSDALFGLSLSLTGAVNPAEKKLIFSPRYDSLTHMDFTQLKELLPHIDFFSVDHDINAQSSSVMDKYGREDTNYAFVHCGEGVGMAFHNDGTYTGYRGFAGEIGHLPYHGLTRDKACPCGNVNCFETLLSNKGIRQLIREIRGPGNEDLGNLDESIRADPKLNGIIADAVSQMLIMISNILDPGSIIIGGEAIDSFIPAILPVVERTLREKAWQGGVHSIQWFKPSDINCAYGTIINSSAAMVEAYIREYLM